MNPKMYNRTLRGGRAASRCRVSERVTLVIICKRPYYAKNNRTLQIFGGERLPGKIPVITTIRV
jgi:hypothetical protein